MRRLLWVVLTFNAALLLSQAGVGLVFNAVAFTALAFGLLFGTLRLSRILELRQRPPKKRGYL